MKGRILVVDDERHQRDILQMILERGGLRDDASPATAARPSTRRAERGLRRGADRPQDARHERHRAPRASCSKAQPGLCVVLMTAHGTIDSAVEAMRKGAFDYLTKPLETDELLLVLRRALERTRLVRENRHAARAAPRPLPPRQHRGLPRLDAGRLPHRPQGGGLAPRPCSSTGRAAPARSWWPARSTTQSDRRERPFYAVNVAALPESILEAELFGHEKGAFTGAEARKIGLFEQASGSTLFLDEVGDLKRDLQVKLLRTLQEREILRVGRHRAHQGGRAHHRRHQPRPGDRRCARAASARTSTTGSTSSRSSCRRCASGAPDIPLLVEHFLKKYAGGQAPRGRHRRGPEGRWWTTTGRATCASSSR